MSEYAEALLGEAESWLIENDARRAEKFRRERIRHYRLIRDLLLDKLGTETMDILEVGGGPMPVSDLLPFRRRVVIDPLGEQYAKVIPCPDHEAMQIEESPYMDDFDLVIATNSLDHVERPEVALTKMNLALRSGGYMAICCPENNAITNPHPAHIHNLTANYVHRLLDRDYETVWELTYQEHGYRYGWPTWEGKRGQPAFVLLMRKCSGY